MKDTLKRLYRDESVSVYSMENNFRPGNSRLKRYVVSTRDTRDLMNFPEIINIDFTEKMRNGITNALKGMNQVEKMGVIDSRKVNVYHILRGALNFQLSGALNKAFGYKWHSSSYLSSQRVLKDGLFEISDDYYRKFIVPDNATVYSADIVASGSSLDNALKYLDAFMDSKGYSLKNFIFFTIGCRETEEVLQRWHNRFKDKYPGYDRTVICYLEGRFSLASEDTPLHNKNPDTDLLRSFKTGALLSPEYEYSQFEKMIVPLEGCVIYDGGKKGFEPVNHIKEVQTFWEKQLEYASGKNISLWNEYNCRFPLDSYFKDIERLDSGSPGILKEKKESLWNNIDDSEYEKLYKRVRWLWDNSRIERACEPLSLSEVCLKKIKYLKSLQHFFKR